MRSLRFRLSAWFTAIFALLLAVGAAAFVLTIESGMLADADFFLAKQTHHVLKLFVEAESTPQSLNPLLEDNNITVNTSRFPGVLWFDTVYSRVLNATTGTVVTESPVLAARRVLSDELDSQLRRPRPKGGPLFGFGRPDEQILLRICTTTTAVRGQRYIVQIAVPWDSQQYRLSEMEAVLAASIGVVLVLGAVGGWFLIGWALRPIDRIVRKAERVNADSLGSELLPSPSETDNEIGHLVDTLNGMIARLHDAFVAQTRYAEAQKRYADAQRRFAADASHELRTPLTLLRTEIEYALLKPREAAEYEEALGNAVTDIDRLCRIVESLMFLARLDINRIGEESHTGPIDVELLAASVVRDYQSPANRGGVSLTHTTPSSPTPVPSILPDDSGSDKSPTVNGPHTEQTTRPLCVTGDEEQIRLLLRNLVDNAIKYTGSGGAIGVTTLREQAGGRSYVTITVSDTGIGIAPEEIPHVFERFWRSDRARTTTLNPDRDRSETANGEPPEMPGTGLGLSIARQIAIVHGGDISVNSEVGEGSIFCVRLPEAD